jgi:hypothetical protein
MDSEIFLLQFGNEFLRKILLRSVATRYNSIILLWTKLDMYRGKKKTTAKVVAAMYFLKAELVKLLPTMYCAMVEPFKLVPIIYYVMVESLKLLPIMSYVMVESIKLLLIMY